MLLSIVGRVGGEYTVEGSKVSGDTLSGDLFGDLSAGLLGEGCADDDGDECDDVGSGGTFGTFLSSMSNLRRIALGVAGRPITGLFPLRA